ncbi:MAG: hypothetical protein J6D45_07800 [Clostridia bacterium]|nr:hypothetical protein [Clostridia bacterium]
MCVIRIVGISFILISAIICACSIISKKPGFFNLKAVFVNHFKLFKHSFKHSFLFYGVPLIFASGIALVYQADKEFYSNLSVIISILLSMLFAILSILTSKNYDFNCKKEDGTENVEKKKVVKNMQAVMSETTTAIVFDVMLSIFLVLYALVMPIVEEIGINVLGVNITLSIVSYYLITVILLNLLLIIKRMTKLINIGINMTNE